MKSIATLILVMLSSTLFGCGGGGGGSSTPTASSAPPSGGGAGGGGTGGGGGSTGGGGTPSTNGLISGGAGVVGDTGISGFTLDVVVSGSGAWAGDIQNFSSIIINDEITDTDSASFTIEGVSGSQSDLKQGQQVLIIGDAASKVADVVHYRANVKGPLTSVAIVDPDLGTANLTVLGQAVTTDATTAFSNVDLVALLAGDLVEISGVVDGNGTIRASFVERKTSLAEYKVTGVVTALGNTTFTIGGLTINFANATLSDFDSGAIAANDVVEAKAAASGFTAPDQLAADRVELLPILRVGTGAVSRVEGFVDRFASATDFDVQNTVVTSDSNTVWVNGNQDDLALNVKVQVEGTSDANGTILATRIFFQLTDAIRAEGKLEAIDLAASTVTVLGTTFTVRNLTRLEDNSAADVNPLSLSDLGIGDQLEVRGYLDASTVVATRLEREDSEDRSRLRGPVTAEDAAAGTLSILSVDVRGQSGITQYEDLNDQIITQAEFHNLLEVGDFAKASWDPFVNTGEIADELALED